MSELYTYTQTIPNTLRVTQAHGAPALSNNLLFGGSYYRSKIFNPTFGINPLVAAASPLLTLANHLAVSAAPEETHMLQQHLQHEIKAFENNAQSQGYRSESILVARYLLCTTIDEMILESSWGKNSDWANHLLLYFFHQESDGGERFFIILDRLTADPNIHIDLLELIYLSLSSGFMGKYKNMPDGKELLEQLSNRLFDCIRWQRGELKPELNLLSSAAPQPPVAKIYLPLWLIISFTVAVLLTIYSSFSYMLGNNAQQLYQEINPLLTQNSNDPIQ